LASATTLPDGTPITYRRDLLIDATITVIVYAITGLRHRGTWLLRADEFMRE
jgi:hypothetical protein